MPTTDWHTAERRCHALSLPVTYGHQCTPGGQLAPLVAANGHRMSRAPCPRHIDIVSCDADIFRAQIIHRWRTIHTNHHTR